MVLYRVVRQNREDKNLGLSLHETLLDAYKQCIPSDESEACRRLLYGVQEQIKKGERFIRVTCDRGDIWWIQLVDDPNEAVAEASTKIECCHLHN